jgi:hypothetical protein
MTASVSCAGRGASTTAGLDLRPATVEGPPRTFLVVEVVREARVAAGLGPGIISACRWHVNAAGALYGDHWGWCEDFAILPRWSPDYLVASTLYEGGATGGYSRLLVLPRPGAAPLVVFGRPVSVAEAGAGVRLEFGGEFAILRPRQPFNLGREAGVSVEAPVDTGHFEPGGDEPLLADVAYWAVSYGALDSRRIAGRAG